MNRLSRATALKIAAVLSFLLGVYGIINMSSYLVRGAADLNAAGDAPPYGVVILGFAMAIVRLVTAYGTWKNQRWSVVLTLLANAVETVSAVPGILLAPTTYSQISATVGTIFGILIIVLCLWRDRKPVLA